MLVKVPGSEVCFLTSLPFTAPAMNFKFPISNHMKRLARVHDAMSSIPLDSSCLNGRAGLPGN